MDRRRELKRMYKQMRPDMGLFIVRCKRNNKVYIQTTNDLRTVQNGILVRLNGGMHPNRELQKEWDALGKDAFTMEVLEKLAYGDDASKTDYSEELDLLLAMWEDEMVKQGKEIYQKRIP